jgi:uncharacterized protein (DUF1697 family)
VSRFAVFLRAVNLGSHNRVPMPKLREIATAAGFDDVETYLQSGNLVLTAKPKTKATDVERAIRRGISDELGLDIDVIARSRAELAALVKANPFADRLDDPKRVHLNILAGKPAADARTAFDPEAFLPEEFAFGNRCVYLWYPNGLGRSKLAAAPWAKRLGVPGTDRNWRTITAMLEMLDTDS